jgi:hypothetical protein
MKFEMAAKANKNQVITPQVMSVKVGGNEVGTHCRSVDFHMDAKGVPYLTLDILPTEELFVDQEGVVYFIFDDRKFKCIEVE